jgi:hypothetical protein
VVPIFLERGTPSKKFLAPQLILSGTSSLQMCGLARENSEETAGKEILIRDGVVVVVYGDPAHHYMCSIQVVDIILTKVPFRKYHIP